MKILTKSCIPNAWLDVCQTSHFKWYFCACGRKAELFGIPCFEIYWIDYADDSEDFLRSLTINFFQLKAG